MKSKRWSHQWSHIIVGTLSSQQFLQHFGERLNDRSGLAWKSKLLSVVGWLGPWVGPHRSLMIQVDSECSNQGSKSDPEERDDHHSNSNSNSKIPWISMIHLDLSENWIPAKSRFTMVYHHFACTTVIILGVYLTCVVKFTDLTAISLEGCLGSGQLSQKSGTVQLSDGWFQWFNPPTWE